MQAQARAGQGHPQPKITNPHNTASPGGGPPTRPHQAVVPARSILPAAKDRKGAPAGRTARPSAPRAPRLPDTVKLMPELDFMVVADYVRTDAGVLHMVGAGFDTVRLPAVPGILTAGVGLRLLLDVAEAREPHPFTLIFQNADGARLAEVAGVVGPVLPDAPEPPAGRPYSVVLALNTRLPVPEYGDYSLDLILDDRPVKSITLTMATSQTAAPDTQGDA